MADAVLHAQYAPQDGRGGTCVTGEFIVGPASGAPHSNRFTVFDPSSGTSKVYAVTLPFVWQATSFGFPYNGGVAVAAGNQQTSGATYLLVLYPDGTYDVHSTPLSIGAGVSLCVVPSGNVWFIRSSSSASANVFNGSSWSLAGSGLPFASTTLRVVGSTIWYADNANVVGVSAATGAVVSTFAVGGLGAVAQTEVIGDRLWGHPSAAVLRGVRLSDGNIVNLSVPSTAESRLAGGSGKLWVASLTAGYEVNPDTSDIVIHPHPGSYGLGSISQMFFGAGHGWAMGNNPIS